MSFFVLAPLFALVPQLENTHDVALTVTREGGTAVGGADVRWFEGEESAIDLGRIEDRASASGNFATTDDHGRVTLQLKSELTTLVARAPGVWGWTMAHAHENEMALQLRTDRDLVVDIVDGEGQPIGDLAVALERGFSGNWKESAGIVLATRSDSRTGRAVLRHAGHAFAAAPPLQPFWFFDSGEDTWRVAVVNTWEHGGLDRTIEGALPIAAIRLVVDERAGDVEVVLREFDGSLARGVDRVHLVGADYFGWIGSEWIDPGFDWLRRRRNGQRPIGVVSAEVRDGRALFRCLPKNAPLMAFAFRNDASAPSFVRFDGPSSGERRTVDLTLGSGAIALRLCALLDGQPLRSTTLGIRHSVPKQAMDFQPFEPASHELCAPIEVETDADGVFGLDLCGALALDSSVLLLSSAAGAPQGFEAWLDVADLTLGPHDLVDVELAHTPLALSGIVVNDAGTPLAGVEVAIHRVTALNLRIGVQTDALGRFELRTAAPWHFNVEVSVPGAYSEEVQRIAPGTTNLRVMVRRPADVRGYLRVSTERTLRDLTVLMLRTDAGTPIETAPGVCMSCSCDGAFEFKRLKAGRYLLKIRERGSDGKIHDLLTRTDVELTGGQTLDLGEIRVD